MFKIHIAKLKMEIRNKLAVIQFFFLMYLCMHRKTKEDNKNVNSGNIWTVAYSLSIFSSLSMYNNQKKSYYIKS